MTKLTKKHVKGVSEHSEQVVLSDSDEKGMKIQAHSL